MKTLINKRLLFLVTVCCTLAGVTSCDLSPEIAIDRDSVQVIQGKYTGETVDLTFVANLTGIPSRQRVYFSKGDARFHTDYSCSDDYTIVYEVYDAFGHPDLKTMSLKAGRSGTVSLPLPVFWTEERHYYYTLRITLYRWSRKQDTYVGRFRLKAPN